jgi:hypothetical protein
MWSLVWRQKPGVMNAQSYLSAAGLNRVGVVTLLAQFYKSAGQLLKTKMIQKNERNERD